jgi:ribose 5-phosphate isomerase A
MRVGHGSGSTVALLLAALAQRSPHAVFVAASPAIQEAAVAGGLRVVALDEAGALDLALDGADQVDHAGWLVKGGGAAHTREKLVAAAARRFVVLVSSDKLVARVRPRSRSSLSPTTHSRRSHGFAMRVCGRGLRPRRTAA